MGHYLYKGYKAEVQGNLLGEDEVRITLLILYPWRDEITPFPIKPYPKSKLPLVKADILAFSIDMRTKAPTMEDDFMDIMERYFKCDPDYAVKVLRKVP